ncbi:MAG: acetyl-CoA hydrolase [Thermoleophilia bacterium]|nr:acetyl-CoA hydrolase [Thermoleophilia bacterium]
MRIVSPDQLVAQLSLLDGAPRVVMSGNAAMPAAGMAAVDAAFPAYTLHMLNAPAGIPTRDGVVAETAFVGPGMRSHPGLSYLPCRLSMVPVLLHHVIPPDIVVIQCAPPRDGHLSLGVEVNILPAAIDGCRGRSGRVVAVINDRMPFTFGDALIPTSHVDLAIEVSEPLPEHPARELDDDSRRIGELVVSRLDDRVTLQMGIGAVPDATVLALRDKRDLRIWTEMFSDCVLGLDQAGALDPNHPITTSFAFGTAELYEWIHDNHRVRFMRTEHTNDPGTIARQRAMTSVNTALEVDLFGQANASRIGDRIYSGFGGQTDFIVGAMHAPHGQAFIALKSWHPKANCSTIVPKLDEQVTSFQQSAIVTEQGVAELWGYDQRRQARHMIRDAAHPDVKDALWEAAAGFGLA